MAVVEWLADHFALPRAMFGGCWGASKAADAWLQRRFGH